MQEPVMAITLSVRRHHEPLRSRSTHGYTARAQRSHRRRREALLALFARPEVFDVTDWGKVHSAVPEEWIQIVLEPRDLDLVHYTIVPGLKYIGEKLEQHGVEPRIRDTVLAIIAWLRPRQLNQEVQEFRIELPDGGVIEADSPDQSATIIIRFAAGGVASVSYPRALPREEAL
jgi:hypothetical protein